MKTIKKLFSIINYTLFVLVYSVVNAQNPSQIDVLTKKQGLLFRHVTSIAQDSSGLMWFGTSQGINRYDGYSFKEYNSDRKNPFFIEEENITGDLLLDNSKDNLWYMANDKLYSLQLSTDEITHYDESKNIKGKVLRILKTENGNIWIITDDYWANQDKNAKQYLQKLRNGKFEIMASIPRNNRGFCRLITDKNGFLWWSTTNSTLKYNTNGDLLETYSFGSYDWFGSELHFIVSFFDDNNTHYYFPNHGGINIFKPTNKNSKRILDSEEQIFYAVQDYQKHIWFAGKKVLFRMNLEGNFVEYTEELKSHFDFTKINSLFIDATNLLWVATDNGLFKIRIGKELFTHVFKSEKSGWGNTMRGVFEDANETLFAFCEKKNKLLYKTKTGKIDSLQLKVKSTNNNEQLTNSASFFVLNDSKTAVFTAGKSFLKIDLKTGYIKNYNKFTINCSVYGPNPVIKLKNGKILFGYTLSRLVLFDPKTEKWEFVFNSVKSDYEIEAFSYFKQSSLNENIIWIGTKKDGLLKLNLNGTIERIYNIENEPRISKNHILVIDEDAEKNLWIGTYGGGLNFISADGNTVENFTKKEGLPDNNVVGILPDNNQNLWISTYNGLSKFDKKNKLFQNFYDEDGLTNNEFNYSSSYKSKSGFFYFGGMNGVNKFKPSEILKDAEPPKLKFLSVSGYSNKEDASFKTDYSQTDFKGLVISPYDQYFEVSWTMPSYFQNQKNTYSTKLEGFEEQWFYQGNSASIRYNQLPAGNYVLKIKGKDSKGNESATILSIPIEIKQIFYKKWWFSTLIFLLILGIMYAIFKYRFQQKLAMERLRIKISSDLHDDVGSLLSGLAMQTELMEINASETDKFKLQKIANISRNAISQMRDLVWSIDSRRETIEDLLERMRELAEELLLPKDISFQIDTNNLKNLNKKLPAQTKQHLFLIYKEAITNVLRHSDANNVTICITNNAKGCSFVIKDNGSKKECYKSTGLGLSNMLMRAEKLKGNLTFKKEYGFTIHLQLPFHL